jgi:hypothetical protein
MPQMLEQLQLPIRPLAQHGGRKGFHDFLDGNRSSRQLILGGTTYVSCPHSMPMRVLSRTRGFRDKATCNNDLPNETKGSHTDWLEVDISRRDFKNGSKDG